MTGAPKPRTMEILAELETQSRGAYSGAIGFTAPNGALRVQCGDPDHHATKTGCLRMGVGGGVVADSVASQEHAECWLKSEFSPAGFVPLCAG